MGAGTEGCLSKCAVPDDAHAQRTVPQYTIDQPFVGLPSNPYLPNPFMNADGSPAYPTGSQINPVFKTPRVHEWNVAMERQFSDTLVASATYAGVAGHFLDCCG